MTLHLYDTWLWLLKYEICVCVCVCISEENEMRNELSPRAQEI